MNQNISISQLNSLNKKQLQDIEILLTQLNPDFISPAKNKDIMAVISHPTTHILVAKDEDKIIGMITLCGNPQVEGNVKIWIEDFVVEEKYRKKGIGTALIQAAHKQAKRSGFKNAVLTSRPSRVVANQYYKKLGYKEYETNVYKINL